MSLLKDLFRILDGTDWKKLEQLPLTKREEQILQLVKTDTGQDSQKSYTSLGISNSQQYKLHTIILHKCLDVLCPGEPIKSVEWLKNRGLYLHMNHRMLHSGKKLENSVNVEHTTEFYRKCFLIGIDVPFRYYNEKLIRKIGGKYLQWKPDRGEMDDNYIKYHLLFSHCNRAAARKNPARSFGLGLSQLLKDEKLLEKTKHWLALYYLRRTISNYSNFIEKNNQMVLLYLEKCIRLESKIKSFFQEDLHQFLLLSKADALFISGEILESFRIYQSLFTKGIPSSMYGLYYHAEQYAMVCLNLGKYQQAEAICNEFFGKVIENKADIYATRGALAFSKLYLLKREMKNAMYYLKIASANNEKTFYLPLNLQIRMLETFLFIGKGDVDFAQALCLKHKKFLQSQREKKHFIAYLNIWSALSTALTDRLKKRKQKDSTAKIIKDFQENFQHLFANLPELYFQMIG